MTAAAYAGVSGKRRQQPTTMAVVAYDKKGTMAYIDGRLRQQPTTVAVGRRKGRGANARVGEG